MHITVNSTLNNYVHNILCILVMYISCKTGYNIGFTEKHRNWKGKKRERRKYASQRASLRLAFMASMMRAASVLAVSSSLEKMRSRPKRRLEFPLRPSMAFRSQESLYIWRLILESVREVFLRPRGGPDRRISC